MMRSMAAVLLLLAASAAAVFGLKSEIRMPGVVVDADTYVCTSIELSDEENYLTGFEALAANGAAHHILLFGCEEPGSDEPVWDCGEMSKPVDGMERAPTCASKPSILYAWAMDAPALALPKDVGFRVGGDASPIRHLVMQVHYMNERTSPDETGLSITHTSTPQPKLAATMLLVTGGVLPPNSTESFETACVIDDDVRMHPFAYRTHTHRHGVDVSGWLVREDARDGQDTWQMIGRRDPRLPQMFVPVANESMVIERGDMVTARCVMKNTENREVSMGPSGEDEMCNFYVMYWTDGEPLQDNTCFSPGAPDYRWISEAALNHIPK